MISIRTGDTTIIHAKRERKRHNMPSWGPCRIYGHFLAKIQLKQEMPTKDEMM
jgi:hypothetical protein